MKVQDERKGVPVLAILSHEEKQRLLLLNTASAELFFKAVLSGLVLTVIFGIVVAIGYFPEGDEMGLIVVLLVFLALWSFGGLILRSEYAVVTDGSSFGAVRAPILSTLTFVVLLGSSIALYQMNPNALWLIGMLEISFVVPVLALFVLTALFSYGFRTLYLRLLHRGTDIDFYEVVNRGELNQRLRMFWEYSRRYGEPLYLTLIRVDTSAEVRGDDRQKVVEHIIDVFRTALRKSDIVGQQDSRTLWIIFSRTSPDKSAVPIERVKAELEEDSEFRRMRNELGVQLSIGLAGYVEKMSSERDLLDLADEAVRSASLGEGFAIRGIPDIRAVPPGTSGEVAEESHADS